MKAKIARCGADFVSLERHAWRENHLLGTDASRAFQKFTDEAFRELRRTYFSRADLAAEMKQRSRILQELWRDQ
jgi:hypothetical protein